MRISDWGSDVCSSDRDLPAVAPGLSAQVSGSGTSIQFSIRGQGLTLGQSAPGVVPYFAEVPEFSTQFYDLEGVQVLKGPQGTLFGRNTTGGAILFSPRQPDNEFGGFITRSAEHKSELQSLMRISYAVFCLKKKK